MKNGPTTTKAHGHHPPPPSSAAASSSNGKKSAAAKKKPASKAPTTDPKPAATAPPGFGASPAPAAPTTATGGFSESQQRLLRHRALFVFRFLVGKAVEVELVDTSRYVGILDCIDPDNFSIVLKNTQRTHGGSDAEPFASGSTVIFKRRQLAHMSAEGVVNYAEGAFGVAGNGAAAMGTAGFRTDTEITGRGHDHLFGRELQSAASWLDPQLDTGDLEDGAAGRGRRASGKAAWNQFEVNEKLFGVVSSFDENLYTTKLDKTKISNEKSREAERIAREIEREMTGNFHLQEERGQAAQADGDLDEEARYSSVDRKAPSSAVARGPNAYVPPALRNAQKQTASAGAGAAAAAPATAGAEAASAAPSSAAPAPAAPAATTAPRKPISFSEAVTGRPAAAATPASAPVSSSAPTAATSSTPSTGKTAPGGALTKAEGKKGESKSVSSPKKKSPSPTTTKDNKEQKKAEAKKAETKKADPKGSDQKTGEAKASAAADESKASKTKAAPVKKGLNPNAKEFKLSASAAEFTPKFMQGSATSSPYRQPGNPFAAMGGHMHPPPPHPGMAGVGYPAPEEWMYEGGGVLMDDGEYMHPAAYMGYGVPMMPNPTAMMQQQAMYPPPMMPQPGAPRSGVPGAQQRAPHHPHGGGYGYAQPGMFTPRGGYYGVPPGAMGYAGPPQPPLPPTPGDPQGQVPEGSEGVAPASPSQRPPEAATRVGAPDAKAPNSQGSTAKK